MRWCGRPSSSRIAVIVSRPSLMPKSSRRASQSRSSMRGRWRGVRSFSGWSRRRRSARPPGRGRRLRHHEPQRARDGRLQLASIDDEIDEAVLEQELAALEPFGQLLADGLLDHARTGETDERARLGDVQVAEHREARGHAARRRIGQDRQIRQPGAIEPRQRRADLRHLHQRERALHHPRAAGARHDDHREPFARDRARWHA